MVAKSSVLRAEGLMKRYGTKSVVNGVNIELKPGEIVGLLGPNGAGKTTTFYMITGMIKSNKGNIFLEDNDITNFSMARRARMGIGYLSQEPSVLLYLTVEQNLIAIMQALGIRSRQRRERADQLMKKLGIEHLADKKACVLSGGERRRLEIARALIIKPKALLLDEPFSGVDPIAVFQIQGIIRSLREQGIGILLTDHSVRETLEITDIAYIMSRGKVLVSGTAYYLINDKKAREIYLGERFKA